MEKKLLSLCLKTVESIIASQERGITKDFFEDKDCGLLYHILQWYFKKYKTIISEDALKTTLSQATLGDESKGNIMTIYYEVALMKPLEPTEAVIDYMLKEYKARYFKNLLRDSIDNLNPDKIDSTLAVFLKECNKITSLNKHNNKEGYYNIDAVSRLEKYRERKDQEYIGITYGFSDLDNATGGHLPGELWIMLGALKSGKSTVLLNMANHVWKSGKNVIYFSAEMSKDVVNRRLDGINAQLSINALKRGKLREQEEQKYLKYLQEAEKRDNIFYVVERPAMTTEFIRAKIQELKQQFPVDAVVVDYLGICQLPWKEKTTWERVGNVAWELREIAASENVPMLTAHQMNRQEEISNSIDVGRHCDLMMSIKIKDEDEKLYSPVCTLEAQIMLARDAEQRVFELYAEFGKMTITDPNKQQLGGTSSAPIQPNTPSVYDSFGNI